MANLQIVQGLFQARMAKKWSFVLGLLAFSRPKISCFWSLASEILLPAHKLSRLTAVVRF